LIEECSPKILLRIVRATLNANFYVRFAGPASRHSCGSGNDGGGNAGNTARDAGISPSRRERLSSSQSDIIFLAIATSESGVPQEKTKLRCAGRSTSLQKYPPSPSGENRSHRLSPALFSQLTVHHERRQSGCTKNRRHYYFLIMSVLVMFITLVAIFLSPFSV
jgi:hypothetical protein